MATLLKFGFERKCENAQNNTNEPTSSEKRSCSKKKYESKRPKREFRPEWKQLFHGLIYENDVMLCEFCTSPHVTAYRDHHSSFCTNGSTSFRVDSIRSHWESSSHHKCLTVCHRRAGNQGDLAPQGPIDIAMHRLNDNNKGILMKLFNTVYFILKMEMPFTSLSSLLALQKKNGSDLQKLQSYNTDQACRRLSVDITDVIRSDILQKIRETDVISVMFDGATDISTTEVELVYVRLLVDGHPENYYLALKNIEHAHAEGVFNAICRAFTDNNVPNWHDKVVGIGCDGAKVNVGIHNSVATRFKTDHNYIVVMHCVAHRLELGVMSSIRAHQTLSDIKDILPKIYKHYKYSPKAVREVRSIAETMEEKILKPTRVDGTRWTPHMNRALNILATSYTALLTHFEHVAEAGPGQATADVKGRAVWLCRKLKDYSVVRFIFFLLDLLQIVS